MTQPSVSVVIPTFRRPELLADALYSVEQQSLAPIETIVVDENDPGSREMEETRHVCRAAGLVRSRVQLVRNEGARGGSGARNYGVSIARGDLIAFLDDDDAWDREKLQRQVERYIACIPKPGLVFTGLRIVDADGSELKLRAIPRSADWIRTLLKSNAIGTVSSALVPRAVFEDVGGFDTSLPSRQDLDLWLRIALTYPISGVNLPLTTYRNHGAGISKDIRKKLIGHIRFYRKHRALIERDSRVVADYHYNTGLVCLRNRRFRLARALFRRSLRSKVTLRAAIRWLRTVGADDTIRS
jgi:glycosyltransferase involved in cell wall biosynthesis